MGSGYEYFGLTIERFAYYKNDFFVRDSHQQYPE
jgi:hypothetical protein